MKTGSVFDIQKYSLHDGGGIRTLVFLKGCPLSCRWCSNPESQQEENQLIFSADMCIDCGRCIEACPLNLKPGKKVTGFRQECSLRGKCVEVCPTGALEFVASEMSVTEVIREIEKDRKFYENSGGGVTISGGEPLVQWEFALALIKECKKKYFHVAVETCGYGNWEYLEKFVDYCDLFLYDLKHMNSEKHKKYTGVGNELILDNARKLAHKTKKIIFRVPLLGGINDDNKNLNAVADFACELGLEEIHLLPYHRLGESKYKKLNREYKCEAYTPDEKKIEELKRLIDNRGLTVKIGG